MAMLYFNMYSYKYKPSIAKCAFIQNYIAMQSKTNAYSMLKYEKIEMQQMEISDLNLNIQKSRLRHMMQGLVNAYIKDHLHQHLTLSAKLNFKRATWECFFFKILSFRRNIRKVDFYFFLHQ